MLKRKGFTLIELLAVIVILTIIMVIATPIIIKTIEDAKKSAFKNSVYGIIKAVEFNYFKQLLNTPKIEPVQYKYVNGEESSSLEGFKLEYKGAKPQDGVIEVDQKGRITLALYNGRYCVIKKNNKNNLLMEKTTLENCKIPSYVDISGANVPQLLTGMTPVVWSKNEEDDHFEDGKWITASNINDPYEQNWYDYENKKWANAITKDNSMWVWIPRYAYKIEKGYHMGYDELIALEDPDLLDGSGVIDVKFLFQDKSISLDNTPIEINGYEVGYKDTSTHYFLHPAFDFGGKQLQGFWVAKFSPSNDEGNITIKPNKNILTGKKISQAFDLCREMENKEDIYGWLSREVDTHLMKNIEWGAVTYLSKSQYGAEGIVWNNSYKNGETGCSGPNSNTINAETCIKYNTDKGVKASTTSTIYGIYDLSGGAFEYVMGHLLNNMGERENNVAAGFTDLEGIDDKYIDTYVDYDSVMYGEAVYETSYSNGELTSWENATARFITNAHPWFHRGDSYYISDSSIFSFSFSSGCATDYISFRPVVVPK